MGGCIYYGLKQETREEWNQFTKWQEYGVNQIVLPGEICSAPIN
jgi:hypothetical protein